MNDGCGGSRRAFLATSLKLIGAGVVVVAGSRGAAPVAAQDEGIGASGRQGGDGGGGGGGGRRRQDGAQDAGVGASGRQGGGGGSGAPAGTLPAVNGMPNTGVGDGVATGGATPLLLAVGAVGAAALAMKTRTVSAAVSRV